MAANSTTIVKAPESSTKYSATLKPFKDLTARYVLYRSSSEVFEPYTDSIVFVGIIEDGKLIRGMGKVSPQKLIKLWL